MIKNIVKGKQIFSKKAHPPNRSSSAVDAKFGSI